MSADSAETGGRNGDMKERWRRVEMSADGVIRDMTPCQDIGW
jgi:hypothetical protein